MPRKPTALLEATGAYAKNPARRRPGEPSTGRPIGEPPAHLAPEQAAVWREITGMVALGTLQSSDRVALEALAVMTARMRRDPDAMGGRSLQTFLQLLARFGMTPVDRTRLSIPPREPGPSDPADEFFH